MVGAATFMAPADVVGAQQATPPETARPPATPVMTAAAEATPPVEDDVLTTDSAGSDFMVDVIKSLGFEYICANPGSSFRGLHESVINYGGNQKPELITCCHEESSVAMGHGYFKVEGKPLAVMAHGTVGLQHAAMAIYNAWCDRVPVYIILGNYGDAATRRGAEWYHGAQDVAAMVRDYTKWDDTPWSLGHFAESAVRAYRIGMTPPMAPVVIVADGPLQEDGIKDRGQLSIPKLTMPTAPQGDAAAVAELARLLVAAENPVLVADRLARTPAAMPLLVELAETLQAAVIDKGGRMNFPSLHPLNQSERANAVIATADVVVGPRGDRLLGDGQRDARSAASHPATADQAGRQARSPSQPASCMCGRTTRTSVAWRTLTSRSPPTAEATLPALIEAVKRLVTGDRRRVFEERGARLAEARRATLERARLAASYAWDASPVSTARLCAELWAQIKHEDWSLVSSYYSDGGGWPRRLWDFNKPYHWLGDAGGGGIGYGAPASVGAALANKRHGRLSVAIQTDGDLMYAPGVLWTAAHHKIPLLSIMNNNRAYHMEVMHVQRMCNRRSRGVDRGQIGSMLSDPNIDFSKLAQGLGVHAEGPITNPKDVGPAIARALAVVKRGEPALVDVVTQAR